MEKLAADYWDQRYVAENTPWDLHHASRPLTTFLCTVTNPKTRILIPGGGPGHELAWLWERGFRCAWQLDFSAQATEEARNRYPDIPADRWLTADFFAHNGLYDLILEQTFLAALNPTLRPDWARHMAELLAPGGKLAGVLFDFPLTEKGPPFGGSRQEYYGYLAPHFDTLTLGRCHNSEPERMGKELWVEGVG